MENILFMADSPSDLNAKDIEDKPIRVIPVRISYQGKDHFEFYDINVRSFWDTLNELEEIPTTAQTIPMEWEKHYKKAQDEGYTHILVHTISATASGNYASACMGAKAFMSDPANHTRVVVVDSRSYAYIYGRNVLRAAALAAEGMAFDDICRELREMTRRNRAVLWVYTLKHLRKSGRISGVSAMVGESLGIRPVLLIKDGLIAPEEKVRGDRNLVPKAVELIQKHIVDPAGQDVEVIYAKVPEEEVKRTVELLRTEIAPRSIRLHEIGCAISINTGPASMAVCFNGEAFALHEGATRV